MAVSYTHLISACSDLKISFCIYLLGKEPLFGLSSGLSHNTFTRKSISAIIFHLCIRHTQIGTGTVPVRTPLYFCRHTGNFRIKLKQRYFLNSYKTLATALHRGCVLLYIHRRLLQPSASVCPLFQEIIFVLIITAK